MQHLQPNTTLQGGKYRIKRVLGQGGFGITYLAVQSSLNRYVAIKELFIGGSGQAINDRRGNMVVVTNSANQASFNQQKEKFKKEALRLANLNHPNLVKVHELFEENGTAYYVMDYIDGMSLRTKLNKEGCLPESLVLKYLKQLLSALEVAHRQSIWHLDIKPENIMVDKFDHVCLIDFGASKHIEQGGTLTTSLALAYTRSYCPPELADLSYESETSFVQALKEIGPWTDIYSLGATIYNLLTEKIPPSSNRLYKEGHNAFIFPNTISSSTKDLIVRMMKPNREERPQSINDIKHEVENTLSSNNESNNIERDLVKKENNFIDSQKKNNSNIIDALNKQNPTKVPYFTYAFISGICSIIVGCIGLVGGGFLSWYIAHFFASTLNLPNIGAVVFLLCIIIGAIVLLKVNAWLIKSICSRFEK
ncbi:MAG: serine/threonine protein kinase [Prevotella sp.]|nr:serine/threonine protein kinase [Prevotella sp.]